jgi:CheY-like chemotaxis protein
MAALAEDLLVLARESRDALPLDLRVADVDDHAGADDYLTKPFALAGLLVRP